MNFSQPRLHYIRNLGSFRHASTLYSYRHMNLQSFLV